ncbi:hypothetical protein N7481_012298 [Penicillium waksmanii]|uniref:uncharacterized protein n=1 Tax=Penicillium waksmanii TaxID=69791 RepID=UPI0025490455|nr:uncharacterized protein N7481_012298 [Penicillium waksmanii]KAJ5965584.1 hypothetical protein N7481_012298 [Penicillium waksmanii]
MSTSQNLNLNCAELGNVRDGYPTLASWIGRDPDGETLVFRRFRRLSARNLLHLQSGLIQLEQEIDELDEEARRKEGLLRQSQIAQLSGPSERVLSTYRDYIEGNAWKGTYLPSIPIISGRAKDMLEEADDLVALRKPADEDMISKFLQDHWAFQSHKGTDPLDRTTIHKGRHIMRIFSMISILFAAMLLVAAIISLYVVDNPTTKLELVVAFTFIFALSIELLINARRAEIFGAAAAYAAVLVVFISGNLGS